VVLLRKSIPQHATFKLPLNLALGESMTKTRICIGMSVAFYTISLFLPSFNCGEGHRPSSVGYEVLVQGWLGIIALEPRWYANIFYFYFVVLGITQKKYKPNPYVVFFLFISAISSPIFPGWVTCSAGDVMAPAKGLAIGGYLWVCAILLVVIPALPEWKDESR